MPRTKKTLGYDEQGYDRKEDHLAALHQSYQEIRHEINGMHGFNRLLVDLNGLNVKFSNDMVEVFYMCYEYTTPTLLAIQDAQGSDFFKEFEKSLKKKFKEITKKTLTLKKKSEDVAHEKVSRMQSDTSEFMGSRGATSSAGKYLTRTKRIYYYTIG